MTYKMKMLKIMVMKTLMMITKKIMKSKIMNKTKTKKTMNSQKIKSFKLTQNNIMTIAKTAMIKFLKKIMTRQKMEVMKIMMIM